MNEIFFSRLLAYSLLPLLLAAGHLALDRHSRQPARRIEIFTLYMLAISVGANGLSGAFGHLFLSDLVAEAIGWPGGSPFQQEMGFANLAIGVLGFMAISRRNGFRTATIVATAILGFGATLVHIWDIVEAGNLAPGNTIQNVANLLDPILLIVLARLANQFEPAGLARQSFLNWQLRQQPILGMAAAGIGTGFGLGHALDALLIWTLAGALVGVCLGSFMSRRIAGHTAN